MHLHLAYRRQRWWLFYALMALLIGAAVLGSTVPSVGATDSSSDPLIGTTATADRLQFTAAGHVLGFAPDGFMTASASYVLRRQFVNAHADGGNSSGGLGDTFVAIFDAAPLAVPEIDVLGNGGSIANSDSDENTYIVALQGTGTAPNARINNSDCDLVDAIIAANTNTATGTCAAGTAGADTITLLTDVTLTAVNNSAYGDMGLPVISSVITIEGAGHTLARSTAGGTAQFCLLAVAGSGNLTLNQITLTGGDCPSYYGGGIYNDGTLAVNKSTLSGNTAGFGGGLFNNGTLTVNKSTFFGNSAPQGGGIFNYGTLTVNNSTLFGNTGDLGGGLFNNGTLTVKNSSLSGNTGDLGGGIFNYGTLTVNNSTLFGNTGDLGGGLFNGNQVTMNRSLITGNTASGGAELYNDGKAYADSYNLFGHGGESEAQAFRGFTPGRSDINATSDGLDVALTSILNTTLADNGGDNETHALVTGSPAIDAAGDSKLDTDQRGITRPQGAADDIGAFELAQNLATATPTVTPTNIPVPTGTSTATTPVNTPTNTPMPTVTPTATTPPVLAVTRTPTNTPVVSLTSTKTATPTKTPTKTKTPTPAKTPTPTKIPTKTKTPTPTKTPTKTLTATKTPVPTPTLGKVNSQLDQISFKTTSSTNTPDSTYPAQSTKGVLIATLKLENEGKSLRNVSFRVVRLTQNNYLLNADGGPGQVGRRISVPNSALPGSNQRWDEDEKLTQDFRIGLMTRSGFTLQVDVYASKTNVAATGADPTGRAEIEELLETYLIEVDPEEVVTRLYLPVVKQ